MKLFKVFFALAATAVATHGYAQGVNVAWGAVQAVPLGPMVSITIALSLGLAAVHFLRKQSGTVASMLLAAAMCMGVYGYSMDRAVAVAYSGPGLNIATAAGSEQLGCFRGSLQVVENYYMDPVRLLDVSVFGNATPGGNMTCYSGQVLAGMGGMGGMAGMGGHCFVQCNEPVNSTLL